MPSGRPGHAAPTTWRRFVRLRSIDLRPVEAPGLVQRRRPPRCGSVQSAVQRTWVLFRSWRGLRWVSFRSRRMSTRPRSLRDRSLAISGYIIGRQTGQPHLNFAYPALSDAGTLRAVVVLAFSLDRLSEALLVTPLPSDASMSLVDGDGVLLARAPPAPGPVGDREGGVRVLGGPRGRRSVAGSEARRGRRVRTRRRAPRRSRRRRPPARRRA